MGLFSSKKKKERDEPPELPPFPETISSNIPPMKHSKKELPPLPSFPSSKTGERISNHAAKESIKNAGQEKVEARRKIRTREIGEPLPKQKQKGPVYVRINKYKESLNNFQDIKQNIIEIENQLKNIKDVKKKEEQELEKWQQEINNAKAKIDQVDQTLFQELEQ